MSQITRDVYVLSNKVKEPIDYVRLTNALPIVFHFRDFDIPAGATAQAFCMVADGTGTQTDATISGNDVTIPVQKTMFSVLGHAALQVKITSGDDELVNFVCPVFVKPNYTEGDFPPSENTGGFFDEAKEILEDAETAVNAANSAADAANAAAEAVGEAVSGVINDNQVSEFTTYSSQKLGNFSQLLTTAKNTFVAAINELVLKIGDLKQLATTEKTDIVSAINEIEGDKLDKENIADNLTTTQEGYALDARQGRALDDKVTQLNSALAINVSAQYNVSIPYGATVGELYVDWDDVHRIYRIYGWFDIPVTTSIDNNRKYTINLPPDFPKINSDVLMPMGTPCAVQNSFGVIYGAMKVNTNKTIDFYVPHAHIVAVYLQPIFINIP